MPYKVQFHINNTSSYCYKTHSRLTNYWYNCEETTFIGINEQTPL